MIRFFPNEEWKQLVFDDKLKFRYAISNYGRLISFVDKFENGRLLKGGAVDGYKTFSYKVFKPGKIANKSFFLHRLVAEYFIPKTSEDQTIVLHLDRSRDNNYVGNLKWATPQEKVEYNKNNPRVVEALQKLVAYNKKRDGRKLTSTQVRRIKKRIFDPNRRTRLKLIAKEFGISEMQLYRIKTGENWGHITID